MPFSYAPLSEEAVDIHEVTGDGENNGQFEFPVPDNTRHVAVLLEKITGDVDFQVQGHDNENISTTPNERAELYVYRPFIGVRNVSVRILSKLNSRFKVTVAFFKSAIGAEIHRLKCDTCKKVCRILVGAMLASLGVPYVVGLDTLQDIAVQLGEVSGVTQAFQGLSDVPIFGQLSDGKIGELLASIDPRNRAGKSRLSRGIWAVKPT